MKKFIEDFLFGLRLRIHSCWDSIGFHSNSIETLGANRENSAFVFDSGI